ncbi:MAG: hypothetical protein HY521_14970 [Proteobacteria bacterium]|nr:hypothetical protein [Pseudomonadota bacterium]
MVWSGTPGSGNLAMDGNLMINQASGDPQVSFQIADTSKFALGVDDSDGDALVGSLGGALGTGNYMRVNANGEVAWPLQSAFHAVPSGNLANVTGNGAVYTVIFDGEAFDQNGDYDAATGIFTAPVTGRYQFNVSLRLFECGTATQWTLDLVASNRTTRQIAAFVASTFTNVAPALAALVDMDAGDTCKVQVTLTGTGADTADVSVNSHFSGFLAC